jgi:hypothetical protein
MIVWLSGWPQSGSALTRQIIQQCLEQQTYSTYKELFGRITTYFAADWCLDKYNEYKADNNLWFIKTHHVPMDDCKCIHYVRDGRNAVSSLSRFWNMPVNHIILGESSQFADWSGHYWAHTLKNRLFYKFEDILADPDRYAKAIAEYVGIEYKNKFVNQKEELKKRWPRLFKKKPGNYKEDMTDEELKLFDVVHGNTMKEAGYV